MLSTILGGTASSTTLQGMTELKLTLKAKINYDDGSFIHS